MKWEICRGMGFFARLGILSFLFFHLLISSAVAAAASGDTYLHTIDTNLSVPSVVAVGPDERVYVAEARQYRVQVYSASGQYQSSLSGLQTPISVAVSQAGLLYVGNAGNGSVKVYDANLQPIGALGQGDHEFLRPASIAADAGGNVYVADGDANIIKVYKPDGSFGFSFGAPGMANGQFVKPVAMAINDATGEIIVTDLAMQVSVAGDTSGRVQVFSLDGNFKRRFETHGPSDKSYIRPLGVAVDSVNRIYVSDAFQNVVVVYSSTGIYLDTINDPAQPLRNPLGMDYAPGSSRLFVASLKTATVEIFDIDTANYTEPEPTDSTNEITQTDSTGTTQGAQGNGGFGSATSSPGSSSGVASGNSGSDDVAPTDEELLGEVDVSAFTVQSSSCTTDTGCINYGLLPSIDTNLSAPTSVAVGPDERIYVAEAGNYRVQVYDASGHYQRSLSGLAGPTSVAVARNGLLYVGNADKGSVEIYDHDLQHVGVLGKGEHEFQRPSAMAVDAGGNVYVVDGDANLIKVYKPNHSFNFSFGGTGMGNGEFIKPVAIAINQAAGEVVVSDLAMAVTSTGETSGRVQVFSLTGAYKRRFDTRGPGDKSYIRPLGVAVDDAGFIYVSDAFQNVVVVYSPAGTYLGIIDSEFRPLRNPLGMDYAPRTSRLFVVSLMTASVEPYSLDTSHAVSMLASNTANGSDTGGASSQKIPVTAASLANMMSAVTYTITAGAGSNGSISPSGAITASAGTDLSFKIAADQGYRIEDVVVDGESVGAGGSYNFKRLSADHSIVAEFAPANLQLTSVARGEVSVDHNWKQVTLDRSFDDPVVVAKPASLNDAAPAVVRVRNVTATSFELRIQEWDYLDGEHASERISYLVMESGSHTLADGTRIEAGQFATDGITGSGAVNFEKPFASAPVVVAGVVSVNDGAAVSGRIGSLDSKGFDYRLQAQEANDGAHGSETVAYIAWEPSVGKQDGVNYEVGRTAGVVSQELQSIYFSGEYAQAPLFVADIQSAYDLDTANLRWTGKDTVGTKVRVDEERSADDEVEHSSEVVGYIVIDAASAPVQVTAGQQ